MFLEKSIFIKTIKESSENIIVPNQTDSKSKELNQNTEPIKTIIYMKPERISEIQIFPKCEKQPEPPSIIFQKNDCFNGYDLDNFRKSKLDRSPNGRGPEKDIYGMTKSKTLLNFWVPFDTTPNSHLNTDTETKNIENDTNDEQDKENIETVQNQRKIHEIIGDTAKKKIRYSGNCRDKNVHKIMKKNSFLPDKEINNKEEDENYDKTLVITFANTRPFTNSVTNTEIVKNVKKHKRKNRIRKWTSWLFCCVKPKGE